MFMAANAVEYKTATRDEIVLNLLSHVRELDKDEAWELLEKVSEILDRERPIQSESERPSRE